MNMDDDNATTIEQKLASCWPRTFLPLDFPNARVISVGYDIFLSKWYGDALPLDSQGLEILRKLKLAGIGDKPIVWVVHSFGK